jgi:hypothetical protein
MNRGGMNERNNMVIYDQWSYMTMLGIHIVVFIALGEGIQKNSLLFVERWEE